MSLKVICTRLANAFFYRAGSLPLLRFMSTKTHRAQKVNAIVQEVFRDNIMPDKGDIMPEKMTFGEFERRCIKSFSEYKQTSYIQELYGEDEEEIKKAYESYRSSMLTEYRYFIEGGDPGTML